MPPTFCLAEDRAREEIGLRLAIASIATTTPDARIFIYREASEDFRKWLARFPMASLIPHSPRGASSWNCKPQSLLPLLDQGVESVTWLDSDILLTRDPSYLLESGPPEQLVLACEPPSCPVAPGTEIRTKGWNLEPGRSLAVTLNSCVLRVTPHHKPLLRRWQELLDDETYRRYQTVPIEDRPIHVKGDQDVLNALLGSNEFRDIPLHTLRGGVDLIHCGGALTYTLGERARGVLRQIPPFLHSPAAKPWFVFDKAERLTGSFWFQRRLLQEVSPYFVYARRYRHLLGMPCPWVDAYSALGVALRLIGLGHFAIRGLPLTLMATLIRR